jgi:hypothetical protein
MNTRKQHQHPPEAADCPRSRLAEGRLAAVDTCECGMLQVHVGALTLRMAPCTRFRFEALAPGAYTVSAHAPGLGQFELQTEVVAGRGARIVARLGPERTPGHPRGSRAPDVLRLTRVRHSNEARRPHAAQRRWGSRCAQPPRVPRGSCPPAVTGCLQRREASCPGHPRWRQAFRYVGVLGARAPRPVCVNAMAPVLQRP